MSSVVLNERLLQGLTIICFLLPTCMIYAYEASVSLKVWLTVQELPPPSRIEPPETDNSKIRAVLEGRIRKHARRDVIILLLLSLAYVFSWLASFFKDEPHSRVDGRTRLLLFFPMLIMSAKMMDTLSVRDLQLDELYVIRSSDGVPFLTSGGKRKHWHLGFRFPVFALSYGTLVASYILIMQGTASSFLSFTYMLFFLVTFDHEGAFVRRFQGRFKLALVFTLMAAFFVVRASLGVQRDDNETVADDSDKRNVAWCSLFYSCSFSYLLFELIALCYRFDYSRAKARDQVSTRGVGIDLDGAKKASIPSLYDIELPQGSEEYYGLRLPPMRSSAVFSTADPQFPKPYYTTAWASIALSALLVFILSDVVGLKFKGLETFDAVGFYVMPFTLPLMYSLVLLRAACRGEFSLLWRYEERWTSKPHQTHDEPNIPKDGKDVVVTQEKGVVLEELKVVT